MSLGVSATFEIVCQDGLTLQLFIGRIFINNTTRFMKRSAHKLLFKIFGTKDGYFRKKELSWNNPSFRVIENCPDRNLSDKCQIRFVKKKGWKWTISSSCLLACSTTPSCPFTTMHIRLKSRISVRHTTNESMLKPLPARIPDTWERTPGSFCTRQLRICLQIKKD